MRMDGRSLEAAWQHFAQVGNSRDFWPVHIQGRSRQRQVRAAAANGMALGLGFEDISKERED